jgi:hypothetical protein
MMAYPDLWLLDSMLTASSFREAASMTLNALESNPDLSTIESWAMPSNGEVRPGLPELKRIDFDAAQNLSLNFASGGSALIHADLDGQWELHYYLNVPQSKTVVMNAFHSLVGFAQTLFQRGNLATATLSRRGQGATCVPFVPIIRNDYLIVTTEAEVEAKYEQVDAFWNAEWDEFQERAGRVLLLRAAQALDNADFIVAIIDSQWAMARAAKPHQTEYFAPLVAENEKPIFFAGESRLNLVGYIPDERTLEYSAVVLPEGHIPGWEIYQLREVVLQEQLSDGSPLEIVRVVFYQREMAEREKRPLLDIGAQVFYQTSGGICQITT